MEHDKTIIFTQVYLYTYKYEYCASVQIQIHAYIGTYYSVRVNGNVHTTAVSECAVEMLTKKLIYTSL